MERLPTIAISTATMVRAVVVALILWALFYLRDLVLIVLTSIVIASAIEPAVRSIMRLRIPRVFSVLVVYVLLGMLLVGLFYVFAPLFLEELTALLASLPEQLQSFDVNNVPFGASSLLEQLSLSEIIQSLQISLSNTSFGFVQTASVIFGGLVSFVLIVVFSFYFAVEETGVSDFLRIVIPKRFEEQALALWKRSQVKIGLWMKGQLAIAFLVGVLVYISLTILGVPYALLLALLAAVCELIPLFGPLISMVPAAGIAFTDGGVGIMFVVIGVFVIIQQFENHLLYPLIVTKAVGISPIIVILALLVGGQLAGVMGIILAIPTAVVLQEIVHEIEQRREALKAA